MSGKDSPHKLHMIEPPLANHGHVRSLSSTMPNRHQQRRETRILVILTRKNSHWDHGINTKIHLPWDLWCRRYEWISEVKIFWIFCSGSILCALKLEKNISLNVLNFQCSWMEYLQPPCRIFSATELLKEPLGSEFLPLLLHHSQLGFSGVYPDPVFPCTSESLSAGLGDLGAACKKFHISKELPENKNGQTYPIEWPYKCITRVAIRTLNGYFLHILLTV